MRRVNSRAFLKHLKFACFVIVCVCVGSSLHGQEASVGASNASRSRSLSAAYFEEDILPMLTKRGCNAGACHGAAAGRGYLSLSLFGSDPTSDYDALVNEFQGRRIRFSDPEASLLFAKPTGRIAHGGEVVIDPDSPEAQSLIDWIAHGAPRGEAAEAISLELLCTPIEGSHETPARFRVHAIAQDRFGRRRDVTHLAQFLIDPSSPIKWDEASATASLSIPGNHVLLARYMGRVATGTLTRPYGDTEKVASVEPAESHWIDRCVSAPFRELGVVPAPPVDSLSWLRRSSLDIAGRLPTLDSIREFEQDVEPEKTRRWVQRWIASDGYVDAWTLRMARWLEFRPVSNEDPAAQAFVQWIRRAVAEDRSMRDVARELLVSTGDSHAVGPANFARMASDPRSHAELVSRVFLGARLQCANCHNHPLDRWTQDDYHGLAAIFSVVERGRHVRWLERGEVTNLRTKQPAQPRIPGFGNLPDNASVRPGGNLEAFADWLLDEDRKVFARVFVNRVWHAMMGQGIVEPVDDFRETNPPSNAQLLDALVDHFRRSGYRLRPLVLAIAESDTYARRIGEETGLPSVSAGLFARGLARRLPPEVLLDAVHDALGLEYASGSEQAPLGDRSGSTQRSTDQSVSVLQSLANRRAVHELDPTVPQPTLDLLGRCGRAGVCDSRTESLGLALQLHWLNGDAINPLLQSEKAFYSERLEAGASDVEILQEAYLRIQCRHATARELERWLPSIPNDAHERREWYQDWLWSMLSSHAFLMNR